jgi:hypothetical protein
MSSKKSSSHGSTEETEVFLLKEQVNELAKIVKTMQSELKNLQVVVDSLPKKAKADPNTPKKIIPRNVFISEHREKTGESRAEAELAWKNLSDAAKESYKAKVLNANGTSAAKKPKTSKVAKSDAETSESSPAKKTKSKKAVSENEESASASAHAKKTKTRKVVSENEDSAASDDAPKKSTKKNAAKKTGKVDAEANDDSNEDVVSKKKTNTKKPAKVVAPSDDEEAPSNNRKVLGKPKDHAKMSLSDSDN